MDEGLNTYYDNRYAAAEAKEKGSPKHAGFPSEIKMQQLIYETIASVHRDQPITTPADSLYKLNYQAITYYKTADWFKKLEKELGQAVFDSCIRTYFQRWQFKHPEPEDLQQVFREISGRNLDEIFGLLEKTGSLNKPVKKTLKFAPFFSLKDTEKYNYIFAAPLPGFNVYDGLMAGLLFHNYTLPLNKFQFAIAPLYGFKSKTLNGIGNVGYTFYPKEIFQQVRMSVDASKFSNDDYISDEGREICSWVPQTCTWNKT